MPTPTSTPTASPTPPPAFPVTITDDQGTKITLKSAPTKIASLTPAATEILFKIGAGPRTVAKAEDIDPYPPEADALPIVAKFTGIDVEKIVALGADLVIADTLNPPDAITQLRGLGVPVIVLGATSIDGALKDIELVGDAVGAAGEAGDLTASMRARFDQLGAVTSSLTKPRTFYEIGAGDTIYTVPDPSIYAEMLRLAGADPITTDSSYAISLEKLVAADPEIILLGDKEPVAGVPKRPGWADMTAVKKNAIKEVNDTIVTRPGPRLVDGLEALIKAIHPEVVLPSPGPAAGSSGQPAASTQPAASASPTASSAP
jgi:iron complex transport system substrate-binding protein